MRINSYPSYFILFILCVFHTACASVSTEVLQSYPPKPYDCPLDVYTSEDDITKEYVEVCILHSKTGTSLFDNKSFEYAIERSKPKACKCGADAILVISAEKIGINLTGWGEGRAVVKGIRYK